MQRQIKDVGSKEERPSTVTAGEWVILKDDKIIAHDKDIAKILLLANKYKPDEIIISKEPNSKICFY